MPEWISKRVTLITSSFLIGVFLFLVGPSQIFAIKESLPLLIIGLFLVSTCLAPMIIPALPEIVNVAKEKYPEFDTVSINHLSGALLSCFLGLG